MHKNALPPKTKATPSDSSEEETRSSDEEIQDEEQAEGGSGFESESDKSMDVSLRKSISAPPSRQPPAVKAAAPASALGFPAKRTRQSIGRKDRGDEPQGMRKKPAVATPAPKAVSKQSEKKRATKAERGKSTPPVKEKPSTAEKKSATKRKNKSPRPKTSVSSRFEVKGRQAAVGRTSAEKVTSKAAVVLDLDSSDESPLKVTRPAVVAASGETSGAGKQGALLESVPTTGPAVSAMAVDSKRNTTRVAMQNGAQGGHAFIPEMIEKSGRSGAGLKVSDEKHAENLALLLDMRDTCVKVIQEAQAQSLIVTEKILEETRIKTTAIVEEARVKTCLIMEELRLVIERLGTFAGQSRQTNGSRWGDMYDNPFQGMGLVGGGKLPSGDSNDVKWREQSEAEQGLIIQRLQLVQDQARIQQEGIRLKFNIQK